MFQVQSQFSRIFFLLFLNFWIHFRLFSIWLGYTFCMFIYRIRSSRVDSSIQPLEENAVWITQCGCEKNHSCYSRVIGQISIPAVVSTCTYSTGPLFVQSINANTVYAKILDPMKIQSAGVEDRAVYGRILFSLISNYKKIFSTTTIHDVAVKKFIRPWPVQCSSKNFWLLKSDHMNKADWSASSILKIWIGCSGLIPISLISIRWLYEKFV